MSQLLNPVKLLKDLSSSNTNGRLQVTNNKVTWNVYIENGQIKCAANSVQYLILTLDHHLRCLGLQNAAAAAKSISASKGNSEAVNWLDGGRIIPAINWLVLRKHLQRNEAEKVCASLSLEAIESLLWLKEGKYKWSKNADLPQHVLATKLTFANIELNNTLRNLQQKNQSWKTFSPAISTPYQCPYLDDNHELTQSSAPILLKLAKFLKGLSFRQLALILNQDELKIAQLLHPSIKSGQIVVKPPQSPFNLLPLISAEDSATPSVSSINQGAKFKVACIDDSPTILDEMQRFLSNEDYEITRIEDPLKAAPILLRFKPDLILMDISMPNINGYKLCNFFRASASLKQVPIIMVSGRTGFIDKTRAKMVGATDYLTKPFSQTELLSVVNKYLAKAKVST